MSSKEQAAGTALFLLTIILVLFYALLLSRCLRVFIFLWWDLNVVKVFLAKSLKSLAALLCETIDPIYV